MSSNSRILLFDLGGVLLQLNNPSTTFGLHISEAEFLRQWIRSPSVRRFEQGSIDSDSFAANIVEEIDLPYDADEFLQRFEKWPGELYPRALDLLDAIPDKYPTALLSNTNALHWQRAGFTSALESRFDNVFLSYITRLLKPDVDAFLQVQMEFSCATSEVVFFDDNPANIDAACEFGYQAFLTRGCDELRSTLTGLGVLA